MRKTFFLVIIMMANSVSWQGCEYETLPGPVDCDENPVILELVSVEDSNCALKDGSLQVTASGGTGNYRFRLGAGEEQMDSVFHDLAAGVYEISVADENNCTAVIEALVRNKNGLNITFETTEAGCDNSNGSITITPFDGISPYHFKIDDTDFVPDNMFAGLSPGDYRVIVKDATGCEVSQSVKVRSGVSFSATIKGIIESNCAINDCHNGSQFPDFRVFKNIHDNASLIKVQTITRTMPIDGTLTQAQINAIACWADDGAPAN